MSFILMLMVTCTNPIIPAIDFNNNTVLGYTTKVSFPYEGCNTHTEYDLIYIECKNKNIDLLLPTNECTTYKQNI